MTEIQLPAEQELRHAFRGYERVKLVIVSTSLALLLLITGYGVSTVQTIRDAQQDNKKTLTLIQCALSAEVQQDEGGNPRPRDEIRTHFDACVKRGFAIEPWPPATNRG